MPVRGPNAGQSGRRPEAPLSTPPLKRRRRPPLACFQCRRRKVKCDQERPCNNCIKAKIPDCNFPPSEIPGSLDHGPDLPTPQTQANSVSYDSPSEQDPSTFPEQSHVDIFPEVESASTSTPALPRELNNGTRSLHVSQSPHDNQLLQRIKELEETVKQLSNDRASTQDAPHTQSQAATGGCDASGVRFGAQSAWINGTSLVC
jgi:hypothetical protein